MKYKFVVAVSNRFFFNGSYDQIGCLWCMIGWKWLKWWAESWQKMVGSGFCSEFSTASPPTYFWTFLTSRNRTITSFCTLFWSKFPGNRYATEEQGTSKSLSTQTDESSRRGLLKIPKNSFTSSMDCFFFSFMRGIFDADKNASSSDGGSSSDNSFSSAGLTAQEGASSDRSFPSADLVAWERVSFKLPTKGRASKAITLEKTSQNELLNHFESREDENPKNDDTSWESVRKSPLTGSGRNRARGKKPHQTTTRDRCPSNSKSGSNSPANEKQRKTVRTFHDFDW